MIEPAAKYLFMGSDFKQFKSIDVRSKYVI